MRAAIVGVAVIVVIAALALGAWYFWGQGSLESSETTQIIEDGTTDKADNRPRRCVDVFRPLEDEKDSFNCNDLAAIGFCDYNRPGPERARTDSSIKMVVSDEPSECDTMYTEEDCLNGIDHSYTGDVDTHHVGLGCVWVAYSDQGGRRQPVKFKNNYLGIDKTIEPRTLATEYEGTDLYGECKQLGFRLHENVAAESGELILPDAK